MQEKELFSIKEIDDFVNTRPFAFLYISSTHCSVCHALLPKIKDVIADFPKIHFRLVNADHVPAISGHLSVFSVPALILFVNRKEVLRETRFVHIEPFRKKVKRMYSLAQE